MVKMTWIGLFKRRQFSGNFAYQIDVSITVKTRSFRRQSGAVNELLLCSKFMVFQYLYKIYVDLES